MQVLLGFEPRSEDSKSPVINQLHYKTKYRNPFAYAFAYRLLFIVYCSNAGSNRRPLAHKTNTLTN